MLFAVKKGLRCFVNSTFHQHAIWATYIFSSQVT
jgi:hypothetical protein